MTIDYQALREAAEKATWGDWDSYKPHRGARGYEVRLSSQAIAQHVLKNNAEFIAAFNPKIALALLDERERNQQYIKRRDQENEDIALTVGKLRVELEGKDSKIANLTAERDALREGEMGDARHSNTRAAADIYFQLVEECEIPAGGSLVEYVDDMREKLEAAEKRIAELEKSEEQLINERDHAESALADMYFAATGDRPEWSNWFGFSDAVDAVVDRIADLEAKQPSPVVPEGLIKAVRFYEQVKRENPPVETGAWKDAVDWVLKEACQAVNIGIKGE
ncbi:ead/Ea22-like family protein [Escherichia coli]